MKKRILIFIDWFTPGYKAGGPVSSNTNMIAHLGEEFQFLVVTRNTDYTESTPYSAIIPNTWTKQEGFEGFYIDKAALHYSSLKKLFRETGYDMVYVNGIYSWYFSILPLWFARKYKKQLVVCSRGMLSAHALGVKSLKKNIFIGLTKMLGFYNQVVFHATNQEEALAIQKLLGNKTNVQIAPNLPRKAPKLFLSREKNPGQINLASVARISPEKNTLFAIEAIRKYALKHLAQSSENNFLEKVHVNFDLYGPVYDQEYWKQCQEVIKCLPSQVRVNYRGSIAPEKLGDVFENAHFLLMPSQGENFGHTILESLQHGCPVIISDRTPWRGLQQIASVNGSVGWDLSLEQPEKFTEVLESCISMDQEEYSAMSLRAFNYAKTITEDIAVVEANRRLFEGKG